MQVREVLIGEAVFGMHCTLVGFYMKDNYLKMVPWASGFQYGKVTFIFPF